MSELGPAAVVDLRKEKVDQRFSPPQTNPRVVGGVPPGRHFQRPLPIDQLLARSTTSLDGIVELLKHRLTLEQIIKQRPTGDKTVSRVFVKLRIGARAIDLFHHPALRIVRRQRKGAPAAPFAVSI